jgi:DNA gyrase subunit A
MLVTDVGRLIRVPADQVRITARQTMGVTLFRLSDAEQVTSIFPVIDDTPAAGDDPPGDDGGEDFAGDPENA